jgi:glycosyltransferase involved in cell wall biosynthesis
MRILQVLDYVPGPGGGMMDHMLALALALRERGDELLVAFPARGEVGELERVAAVIELPQIRRPVRSGFRRRLHALCRERGCDLAHLHFSFALPLSLSLGARRWPLPTVYHWHNPPKALLPDAPWGPRDRGTRGLVSFPWISRALARLADRRAITTHLAVSGAIRDLLVGARWTAVDRVTVLPNGVRPRWPDSKSGGASPEFAPRHAGGEIRIGCVANFRPQKDHLTLLRAFSSVAEAVPQARLLLLGDGPTRSRMEALASELGIADRVEFAGSVPNADLDYRDLDIVALATRYEGNPLTVLEAMASAIPVVATAVAGMEEVVSDGVDGVLVPPEDPPALASALLRLARDAPLRLAMGRAGLAKTQQRFSVELWADEAIRIYESVLDGPPGRRGSPGPADRSAARA